MDRPIVIAYTKIGEEGLLEIGVISMEDNEKDADDRVNSHTGIGDEDYFKVFKLYPAMW